MNPVFGGPVDERPGMAAFGNSMGGGRRSAPRTPAPLIARISTLSKTVSAQLIDVSSTGARLRGTDLPPRRADVLVSVEGLKAFGAIMWADGEERGVKLDPPLQAGEVLMLRHRVLEARGVSPELKAAMDDWELGMAR